MLKNYQLQLVTVLLMTLTVMAKSSILSDTVERITHRGELRLGAVRTEDSDKKTTSTLSMGGRVSLSTKPIYGINATATLFTTNPLFGKKSEGMFLSSDERGYSIVGESYLEANFGKNIIKVGRQILDTPYADSDDIGMIPNSFEGYSLVNQDIEDSTIVLALLDRWSGVDAPLPERFTKIQESGDAFFSAGFIYEGLANTTLQAWHYKLDNVNFNYAEIGYGTERFNIALQYTDQDNSNVAYGLSVGGEMEGLSLHMAYNRVDGMVSNGFGGGPFFTSSEDHTIAEVTDQEAIAYGAEYLVSPKITVALSHSNFDKGEYETDYLASFEVNKNHTLDIIYSDMYDDGNMVRFFANYQF